MNDASGISNDSGRPLSRQGSTTNNFSTIGLNALKVNFYIMKLYLLSFMFYRELGH